MYLATVDRRATAAEIAQLFDISLNHLAKVVNRLARLGYIRCLRGVGGGLELNRQPDEIRLGDVIAAMEGEVHLLDCVGTPDVCVIQSFCKLKNVLGEAEHVQRQYLNTKTLLDVIPTKRQLVRVAVS